MRTHAVLHKNFGWEVNKIFLPVYMQIEFGSLDLIYGKVTEKICTARIKDDTYKL